MSVEVEDVVKKLLRGALSVIYITVVFFLVLTWLWGNYVGVTALVIAYLVRASILYPHVFRPLIRLGKEGLIRRRRRLTLSGPRVYIEITKEGEGLLKEVINALSKVIKR